MEETLELRVSGMLSLISDIGVDGFDDSKIEELESLILECQSVHQNDYTNSLADSIYDTLYGFLKEVKPESGLLSEVWEDPDEEIESYTSLLESNPMYSIETAKSLECSAFMKWVSLMPDESESYFISYKINGHGIRVVYDNGVLVSATSRARASKGRDLTSHLKVILGEENPALKGMGIVELRGEVCLRLDKLEEARLYNPGIKSAFSAVSSLLRPSTTIEELGLLDFLAYGFIMEGFSFPTREEEFQMLEESGYSVPGYVMVEGATRLELPDLCMQVLSSMEEEYEEFGYFCDGLVVEINSREIFSSLGVEGNHNLGNIALKAGVWQQDQYVGYVQTILWTKGKNKLSPVALVADEPDMIEFDIDGSVVNLESLGVLTAQGNRVRRVPLYEPKNILILDAYVGNILCFRYGGEAGVVPCFPDGRSLNEDVVVDIVNGESVPWQDN